MDDFRINLQKFFCVVLIFGITAVNLWLFGNFLYQKNVFSKDRKCIISSIAFSDLLVGLFCLTVEAALHFEIYFGGLGCALSYVQVYSYFFCPFVYCIGLMLLSVELILQELDRSFYSLSKFLMLFISFLPWLTAIIVIIPLVFVGASKNTCWHPPLDVRGICVWTVTLVPIGLSLVTWLLAWYVQGKNLVTHRMSEAACIRWDSKPSGDNQGEGVCQSLIQTTGNSSQASATLETSVDASSLHFPSTSITGTSAEPMDDGPSGCSAFQVMENQQSVSSPTQTMPYPSELEEQVTFTESKDQKKRRERIYLLLVVVVFISLTAPFLLYNLMQLMSFLYGNDALTSLDTFLILKWMHISRSFFVPLSWSVIFYAEKCKTYPGQWRG